MCLSKTMQFVLLATLALIGVLAEPQNKDYLPPKQGPARGGGAGRPGQDEGPNEPANYDYSYEVLDDSINLDFGHKEKRLNDQATGSYHVLLPDGRTQFVDYEAGPEGYRPQIRYEGTANLGDGKGDGGYNYNAASNQDPVRQVAPNSLATSTSKIA
ncbi:pro-resilin-like [Arctopsyche grandis]|uniref:pro-resilin-like n=1 Tax=Arctopsyche grandis TaxID=121162 RepID=UPI00406D9DF1